MIKGGIALDTSVVIRLLMGEPEEQYDIASKFLSEQLAGDYLVFVSDLVLAEAYFALQSFYQLPKNKALEALKLFVFHSGITVNESAASVLKIPNLATKNPGFVDRLIHGAIHAEGLTLVTFEKAGAKLPSAKVL